MPDALDETGRELSRLARVSLVASAIAGARDELSALLALASADPALQARALVELVEDGCVRLRQRNERFGEVATLLFGAEPGYYGRPYAERLADAAEAWKEGTSGETFNRRHRAKVIRELTVSIKSLRRDADAPAFRLWLERDPAFRPLTDEDDRPNLSYVRLGVRACSYLRGVDRRPSYTDWTYRDVMTRPHDGTFRLFTKEDNAWVQMQGLSRNVRAVRALGINPFGYQVWLMQLLDLPPVGEPYSWSVRKTFHRFDSTEPEPGWVALAVSQPSPIETGLFALDFTQAEAGPIEFCQFVTPKQTLPNLRGTESEVHATAGIAAAPFEQMQRDQSYGLMWSWHRGGLARRITR